IRCSAQSASLSSPPRSAPGSASITISPGTSACALATALPIPTPSAWALASGAVMVLRRPVRPTRTSGASGGGDASPDFLLRRSVDHLGRKSDTTLGIASLHFKICTFSCPASDQLDQPAGPAETGNRQGGRGQDRD